MKTLRHNYSLIWFGVCRKLIAPRYFQLNDNVYFVHICDFYCQRVEIYIGLEKTDLSTYSVVKSYVLKLHSNTKGLYFDLPYWKDYNTKSIKRIYLGE